MKTIPIALLALTLLGACATPPRQPPRIERLTAEEAARLGATLPRPVSIDDVIALSRANTPPQIIIERMRQSASVYRLNDADIQRLRGADVEPMVIEHMTAQQRSEAAQLARQRAEDEARLARQYVPYGPSGPCGPFYPPSVSVGVFGHRGHVGYGVGWGIPLGWPCW